MPNDPELLTFDSNIPVEVWKDQDRKAVVEQLLALARTGKVSLSVTARIREDVPGEPLVSEIELLPELGVAEGPSVARLGFWVLGRDMLGSDAFVGRQQEIDADMRHRGHTPPDWRDWDHLHAHVLQGRDVFLSWDRRGLEAGEMLELRAMTPEDYLTSRRSERPDH